MPSRSRRPPRTDPTASSGGKRQHASRLGQYLRRLREPTRAAVAPGETPGGRLEHVHTAAPERGDVLLHGRVLPHLGVHGRAEEDRGGSGDQRGHEKV